MLKIVKFILPVIFIGYVTGASAQIHFSDSIVTGAAQTNIYLPLLKNKKVAVVANQTSLVNNIHLVDILIHLKINVIKVFCPEHGFRGTADAGQKIDNSMDTQTGLPVISLYGKHKKPTVDDLSNIDVVVFDIQDVGVRFYTYISTLHYVMEACAENHISLLVLDRPNPNGYFIDGPVLDTTYRSFVGMHPVPLVYGMTIGEYALMINGEHFLKNAVSCNLSVIPCKNYNHNILYKLPVKPSPNLPNIRSILLYPSLGLFEGTIISVGRGTDFPFQVFGHPDYKKGKFKFTPESRQGAKNPKYKNILCKGVSLQNIELSDIVNRKSINLQYLINAYNGMKKRDDFFNNFFYKLAGNEILQQQIKRGMAEQQIRKSWQQKTDKFKVIRKNYLLYPDFE
jgi:uncharacterized protein YbbC (DUF1343 family)